MSELKKCLFCERNAKYESKGNYSEISCSNCGHYKVSDIFADQDEEIVKRYLPYKHLISGLIREKNDLDLQLETIITGNIDSLINDAKIPKTIMQKLDKILLYYYRKTKTFGEWIEKPNSFSIGYAKNLEEFDTMVDNLKKYNYLEKQGGTKIGDCAFLNYRLTLDGMKRAEELSVTNKHSDKVFLAAKFNCDVENVLDKVKEDIKTEFNYRADFIKDKEYNGGITDKIIAEINTSKFVIADFTYNNQGVYFEAGYAQGRGLEVIRTCKKAWFDDVDEKGNKKNHLHFDINHYNFILWENYDDLKEKLINRIRATIIK